MRKTAVATLRLTLGTAAVLAACAVVAGCQKDAQFSQKEIDQMKNPPKQMPAQAQALMQQMNKGGGSTPPRPVGQPGPGGPAAPTGASGASQAPGRPVGQPGPAGPVGAH